MRHELPNETNCSYVSPSSTYKNNALRLSRTVPVRSPHSELLQSLLLSYVKALSQVEVGAFRIKIMGNSISEQLKEQQKKNDKEAVQELQMLQELMANKVAAASAKMREEALRDTHLPIVAFVDTSEKYSVNVSNVPDDKITKSIKDMFGGDFVGGLIGLIGVALNQFLGNTQAGASEQFDYHIILSNNSLMRVDFMFYKYEFSSKGIEDKHQSGFCYSTQAAVLDLKKVSPEVLLYALTRSVGQSNVSDAVKRLHALAEFGEELYQVINKLNEEPKKSIIESDDDPDHREAQIRQLSDEV